MRIKQGIVVGLLGLLSGAYEATVWGFAPALVSGFHPAIPGIALLILYEQPAAACLYAAAVGLVVDLFAVDAPRFMLGGYVLIALGLGLMARSVFTNRSLYAGIALCLVARLVESLWMLIGNVLLSESWRESLPVLTSLHWWTVPLWDSLIMGLTFAIGVFIGRHLHRRGMTQAMTRPTWYG